jgi:hypothetical protein
VAPHGETLDQKALQRRLVRRRRARRERHGFEPDQGPEQLDEVVLAAGDVLADPALELGGRDYRGALG